MSGQKILDGLQDAAAGNIPRERTVQVPKRSLTPESQLDLIVRARTAIGIFLNQDKRFTVNVGGNPIALEKMVTEVSQTLHDLDAARDGLVVAIET